MPFVIGLQTLTASEHHVCTCTVINTIASVMSNWCCSHSVHNLEMPSDWILFDGLMKIVRKGPRKTGVECVMFLVCLFPQRQGSGKRDHKRQGSQDKIRVPRSSSAATETAVSTVSTNCTDVGQRRKRRKWITEKPNISLNLWSVMKNCIGKELSKIPMPVSLGANSWCVLFWYVSVCVAVCVCVCVLAEALFPWKQQCNNWYLKGKNTPSDLVVWWERLHIHWGLASHLCDTCSGCSIWHLWGVNPQVTV